MVRRVTEEGARRSSGRPGFSDAEDPRPRRFAREAWRAAGWFPRHLERHDTLVGDPITAEVFSAEWAAEHFRDLDLSKLRDALEAFDRRGGSVMICGPRGRGKTQLACWLGMRDALIPEGAPGQAAADYRQQYVVWRARLEAQRATFDDERGRGLRLPDLLGANLVVLDEVQEDSKSDFARSELTLLIDHRYGHMRRSIVVANCKPEQLQETLGTSAFSRLNETGGVLYCDWEPYR